MRWWYITTWLSHRSGEVGGGIWYAVRSMCFVMICWGPRGDGDTDRSRLGDDVRSSLGPRRSQCKIFWFRLVSSPQGAYDKHEN